MRNLNKIILVIAIFLFSTNGFAYMWVGAEKFADNPPKRSKSETRASGGCDPARTSTELAVNNVRALVHTGGDMWWDLQKKAKYEVPKGSGCHALYAGCIWVGGKDANGQLKLAAQRFRQVGIDFWPGPLTDDGMAHVSTEICREYDKHFTISKAMVAEFRNWYACSKDPNCDTEDEFKDYVIPDIITNWPAHGPEGGYAYNLAPWWDADGDGFYNPANGDFPYYEFPDEGITTDIDCNRPRNQQPRLFGDHTLWWVYNDKGNVHTETGGQSIGMEFRSQAFAFTTNDELNDMTFYNYNIINRSTYTLSETYFGVWTDADLGNPIDDYVGCDVLRGLGYCYNGDDDDNSEGGHNGYGKQPPAVGIDFFEGPYQDPDGIDNDHSFDFVNDVKVLNCNKGDIMNGNINGLNFGDGMVDNERWGMRRFIYFNNDASNLGDPVIALHYYNYLTGMWKDNTKLCFGGNGHYAGGGNPQIPADFMFPGKPTTDPCGWGVGGNATASVDWSEQTVNNKVGDRRFVQSAGPFVLKPGAVNDITLGAVYARASSGGAWASVEAVRRADDKAQLLFENCFRVLNGPDAPELKIIETDKTLIFHIYNRPNSNNFLESYKEKDNSMVCAEDIKPCDEYYTFQGYQVFQLKDASASVSDRYNLDLARQIFQCDIKDSIAQLVNFTWSDDLAANIPVKEVNGTNEGILHSFVIENDAFASGDNRLINNREYYFSVIAYAHNRTMPYNQTIQASFNGQKKPYLAGRNNIKKFVAIPRAIHPGTITNSDYGDGVEITMHEGFGNANNVLELSQESIDKIMSGSPWRVSERKYEKGRGPVNVKIIDPLSVVEDEYELFFDKEGIKFNEYGTLGTNDLSLSKKYFSTIPYYLVNSAGDIVHSEIDIQFEDYYEQLFMDYGFSISIAQQHFSGVDKNIYQNGYLSSYLEFQEQGKPWLRFLADTDGNDFTNWIRCGTVTSKNQQGDCIEKIYDDVIESGTSDLGGFFEKVVFGAWAPYAFTYAKGNKNDNGPGAIACASALSQQKINGQEPISSVNIVITSDKSKWTRSCVIEMADNEYGKVSASCDLPKEASPVLNYKSEGGAKKFGLRKSPSVDKDGNPDNSGTTGMGWFPGYAIDIVTGERLNIAFGEDSWLVGDNGRDMIWNPTSKYYDPVTNEIIGGKHYIYIMGRSKNKNPGFGAPAYDEGQFMYERLKQYETSPNVKFLNQAWSCAMWTAVPMLAPGFKMLETDVTIKLRTAQPYHKSLGMLSVENPKNDNLPYFSFSTKGVKAEYESKEKAKSDLDHIRVVPNPYYGTSYYENGQLDSYVRITNLPNKCEVSIYTVKGTLVRRIKKDNTNPFVEWDLKNSHNIAISSGVYIFHVNVPGVGEKVVKWFGALRPVDLNNF